MKLQLKEDPREWQKFAWVLCALAGIIFGLATWKGSITPPVFGGIMAAAISGATVSLIKPSWFRGVYRGGMRASFFVGQRISTILLLAVYYIVATPTGLLLRLSGKDLLDTKRRADDSHWKTAAPPSDLTKHF